MYRQPDIRETLHMRVYRPPISLYRVEQVQLFVSERAFDALKAIHLEYCEVSVFR